MRDLEVTMRRYVDDYGIGPWEVYEFNAGNAEDFREYGQPVKRSWRLAVATGSPHSSSSSRTRAATPRHRRSAMASSRRSPLAPGCRSSGPQRGSPYPGAT
jgi:hypothetical protein